MAFCSLLKKTIEVFVIFELFMVENAVVCQEDLVVSGAEQIMDVIQKYGKLFQVFITLKFAFLAEIFEPNTYLVNIVSLIELHSVIDFRLERYRDTILVLLDMPPDEGLDPMGRVGAKLHTFGGIVLLDGSNQAHVT